MSPEQKQRFYEQLKKAKPLTQFVINMLPEHDRFYVGGRPLTVGEKVLPVLQAGEDGMIYRLLKLHKDDLDKFELVLHQNDDGKYLYIVYDIVELNQQNAGQKVIELTTEQP